MNKPNLFLIHLRQIVVYALAVQVALCNSVLAEKKKNAHESPRPMKNSYKDIEPLPKGLLIPDATKVAKAAIEYNKNAKEIKWDKKRIRYLNETDIMSTWTEKEYLEAFIPKFAPLAGSFCSPVVPGDTHWTWDPQYPNSLMSLPSKTMFPNKKYPFKTKKVGVLNGNTVNAPYYEATRGKRIHNSLVFNHIAHFQQDVLRRHLSRLGNAYERTKDPRYARRIAVILFEWAKYFPNYVATVKNRPTFVDATVDFKYGKPRIQRSSGYHGYAHEFAGGGDVYAAIKGSNALEKMNGKDGVADASRFVRDNLVGFTAHYFMRHIPVDVAITTNLPGVIRPILESALVAKSYHFLEWIDEFLSETYKRKIARDNILHESLGYSRNYTAQLLPLFDVISNFQKNNPKAPLTTNLRRSLERISHIRNEMMDGWRRYPTITWPNGLFPPFGDTGHNQRGKVLNAGQSGLLANYGVLTLGNNTGSDSIQVAQHFAGAGQHLRKESAAWALWYNGHEYMGGPRYVNAAGGRLFSNQTLAHQTVTINRKNLEFPSHFTDGRGDLLSYIANHQGISLSEVDIRRQYRPEAQRAHRFLALNATRPDKPYLIDIFSVVGGHTHDLSVHASCDFDTRWKVHGIAVQPMQGKRPLMAKNETWKQPKSKFERFPFYGMWTKVSKGISNKPMRFDFIDGDTTQGRDLRIWTLPVGKTTLFIGETPIPRRIDKIIGKRERLTIKDWWQLGLKRPSLLLRRENGEGRLESLYISIVEPLKKSRANIKRVVPIKTNNTTFDACAFRVEFLDGSHDTCLVDLRDPRVEGSKKRDALTIESKSIAFTGKLAVIESRKGRRDKIRLFGAKQYRDANNNIEVVDAYRGKIIRSNRTESGGSANSFITRDRIPVGKTLQGRHVCLEFGRLKSTGTSGMHEMHEILEVRKHKNEYHILLKRDHKLNIEPNAVRETHHPFKVYEGPCKFEIMEVHTRSLK